MCYYTNAALVKGNKTYVKIKFSKKIKKFLKNFEKSVDKSFNMCYISTVPSKKAGIRTQVRSEQFIS